MGDRSSPICRPVLQILSAGVCTGHTPTCRLATKLHWTEQSVITRTATQCFHSPRMCYCTRCRWLNCSRSYSGYIRYKYLLLMLTAENYLCPEVISQRNDRPTVRLLIWTAAAGAPLPRRAKWSTIGFNVTAKSSAVCVPTDICISFSVNSVCCRCVTKLTAKRRANTSQSSVLYIYHAWKKITAPLLFCDIFDFFWPILTIFSTTA